MHELSLCSAIADAVREHAGNRPVRAVNLRIGHFRQVVPDSLRFCWSMQSADSGLADTDLVIEHVPAVVDCTACATRTELEHPIPVCGSCGSGDVTMISGEEFLIASIDLEPASAGDATADGPVASSGGAR
ncbi:MAG: hydrogenase maturation nickel metallochaperone HypA [Actinomycetota bacterium]